MAHVHLLRRRCNVTATTEDRPSPQARTTGLQHSSFSFLVSYPRPPDQTPAARRLRLGVSGIAPRASLAVCARVESNEQTAQSSIWYSGVGCQAGPFATGRRAGRSPRRDARHHVTRTCGPFVPFRRSCRRNHVDDCRGSAPRRRSRPRGPRTVAGRRPRRRGEHFQVVGEENRGVVDLTPPLCFVSPRAGARCSVARPLFVANASPDGVTATA